MGRRGAPAGGRRYAARALHDRNVMGEALLWAEAASPDELRAYCLSACKALSPAERRDFLAYASGRAAA